MKRDKTTGTRRGKTREANKLQTFRILFSGSALIATILESLISVNKLSIRLEDFLKILYDSQQYLVHQNQNKNKNTKKQKAKQRNKKTKSKTKTKQKASKDTV